MPVLVVLAREALDVVLAAPDGALLRPLLLVREHVGRQVLEDPPAVRVRAPAAIFWNLGDRATVRRSHHHVAAAGHLVRKLRGMLQAWRTRRQYRCKPGGFGT